MSNYDSGNFNYKNNDYLVRLVSTEENGDIVEQRYSVYTSSSGWQEVICSINHSYTVTETPAIVGKFTKKITKNWTWDKCANAEDLEWKSLVLKTIEDQIVS